MSRLRAARIAVTTTLAGAIVGFLGAAFGAQVLAGAPIVGGTGELPEARQFMTSLAEQDTAGMAALGLQADVLTRALRLQTQQPTASIEPLGLWFMGGAAFGPETVQIYAVEYAGQGDRNVLVPYALTVVGGKVVDVR